MSHCYAFTILDGNKSGNSTVNVGSIDTKLFKLRKHGLYEGTGVMSSDYFG